MSGGEELSVYRWSPSGRPRGTVVVVHGLKDHGRRYDELAAALGAEGLAVVAFDLRGHGASTGPRQYVDRFDRYVDDLDRVASTVPSESAGRRFLFAHSMGGAIALRWWLEHRRNWQGLVLSGAALQPPRSVGAAARGLTRLLGRIAPRAGILRLPPEDFSRSPEVVAALIADARVAPGPVPARTAAQLLATMRWSRSRWARLEGPVLALHGSEDRLTDPAGSEGLVAAATAPDKTVRVYPGLYHDLLHEPEREVVLGDLLQWILDRSG